MFSLARHERAEGKQTCSPDHPAQKPRECLPCAGSGDTALVHWDGQTDRQITTRNRPDGERRARCSFVAVRTTWNTVHNYLLPECQPLQSGADPAFAWVLHFMPGPPHSSPALMGRRQRIEGEWGGGPAQAAPKEAAPTRLSSHPTPGGAPPPQPWMPLRGARSMSHVQMPKFAGSHTISRFPSELDFGGPDGLFVALLKPFIDQFVTTDDREGMLLAAEAVNVSGSGYF